MVGAWARFDRFSGHLRQPAHLFSPRARALPYVGTTRTTEIMPAVGTARLTALSGRAVAPSAASAWLRQPPRDGPRRVCRLPEQRRRRSRYERGQEEAGERDDVERDPVIGGQCLLEPRHVGRR